MPKYLDKPPIVKILRPSVHAFAVKSVLFNGDLLEE